VMAHLAKSYPGLGYVLQFPPEALRDGVKAVAYCAKDYDGLARYTLVDPSQGAGKRFDPVFAAEVMDAVAQSLPDAIMGVAGGLSGENVREQVLAVASRYRSPFVIDAEGRLRSADYLGLAQDKVESYLRAAVGAFKEG
ncbi:MAG: hypothetical protein ABIH41_00285, partial [Nanoarchaeota archaeon]